MEAQVTKISWIKINEEIFQMEIEESKVKDDPILHQEWKRKWNSLLDKANKIAGCVKRNKR